jgi:hypothetical protein
VVRPLPWLGLDGPPHVPPRDALGHDVVGQPLQRDALLVGLGLHSSASSSSVTSIVKPGTRSP